MNSLETYLFVAQLFVGALGLAYGWWLSRG